MKKQKKQAAIVGVATPGLDTASARANKRHKKITRVVLRDELTELLTDLRNGRIPAQVAKEAANIVGKMWAGERLALDYYEARKERPPRFGFLDVSTSGGA